MFLQSLILENFLCPCWQGKHSFLDREELLGGHMQACRFSGKKQLTWIFFFFFFFKSQPLQHRSVELTHSQRMEHCDSLQKSQVNQSYQGQETFLFFRANLILAIAMLGRNFSLELLYKYCSYILFCRKGCTTSCHVPY